MGKKVKAWIEAMRLRTLPVSVAGVIAGTGCAAWQGGFRPVPALICLVFAITAQIASNFANEYYDFINGLDKKGREGFRRGVTEGDLSASAMLRATYWLIAADSILGLSLIYWGGWWLMIPGIFIALFAVAYSGGPWPLSHHGLGDLAVIVFFGIVPVTLTCYVQDSRAAFALPTVLASVAIGLMGANVLIVNNYRDMADDKAAGKRTTVVIFGQPFMARTYFVSGLLALALVGIGFGRSLGWLLLVPAIPYFALHILIWRRLRIASGAGLNPLLGLTAINLFIFSLLLTIVLS